MFLSLYFSATDYETLDEMLRTVKNSNRMKDNLHQTPYYSEGGSVRDLRSGIYYGPADGHTGAGRLHAVS